MDSLRVPMWHCRSYGRSQHNAYVHSKFLSTLTNQVEEQDIGGVTRCSRSRTIDSQYAPAANKHDTSRISLHYSPSTAVLNAPIFRKGIASQSRMGWTTSRHLQQQQRVSTSRLVTWRLFSIEREQTFPCCMLHSRSVYVPQLLPSEVH